MEKKKYKEQQVIIYSSKLKVSQHVWDYINEEGMLPDSKYNNLEIMVSDARGNMLSGMHVIIDKIDRNSQPIDVVKLFFDILKEGVTIHFPRQSLVLEPSDLNWREFVMNTFGGLCNLHDYSSGLSDRRRKGC